MDSTILIIEDYRVLRQALSGWLRAIFPGVQVIKALDHAEALDLVQSQVPDVVIMNFNSAKGINMQRVQQLRTQLPKATIILMTSFVNEAYRTQAQAAGANEVISTGRIPQDLQEILQSLLPGAATKGYPDVPKA